MIRFGTYPSLVSLIQMRHRVTINLLCSFLNTCLSMLKNSWSMAPLSARSNLVISSFASSEDLLAQSQSPILSWAARSQTTRIFRTGSIHTSTPDDIGLLLGSFSSQIWFPLFGPSYKPDNCTQTSGSSCGNITWPAGIAQCSLTLPRFLSSPSCGKIKSLLTPPSCSVTGTRPWRLNDLSWRLFRIFRLSLGLIKELVITVSSVGAPPSAIVVRIRLSPTLIFLGLPPNFSPNRSSALTDHLRLSTTPGHVSLPDPRCVALGLKHYLDWNMVSLPKVKVTALVSLLKKWLNKPIIL